MNPIKMTFVSTALVVTLLGGTLASAASFNDVKDSSWYAETIEWAVNNNITTGYEDGTFRPNKSVTEEEFLALLIRSLNDGEIESSDGKWSDPFYAIAKDNNYPISKSPSTKITRQAVAEIIVGTQGKNFVGNDAIQYMLATGLANGKTSATIAGYAGQDTITRAEAVQFIRNVLTKIEKNILLPRPAAPSPKSELPVLPLDDKSDNELMPSSVKTLAQKIDNLVSEKKFSITYDESSIIALDENGMEIFLIDINRFNSFIKSGESFYPIEYFVVLDLDLVLPKDSEENNEYIKMPLSFQEHIKSIEQRAFIHDFTLKIINSLNIDIPDETIMKDFIVDGYGSSIIVIEDGKRKIQFEHTEEYLVVMISSTGGPHQFERAEDDQEGIVLKPVGANP